MSASRAVIWAVVSGEVARLRGPGGLPMIAVAEQDRDLVTLDEAGLGLDSLEQMGVRSALAEIFAIDGEPPSSRAYAACPAPVPSQSSFTTLTGTTSAFTYKKSNAS